MSQPDGSATSGMQITLADAALTDIHTAAPMIGGSVSGIFQPDGRNIDPPNVLAIDPRTAMLSSFTGLDTNGSWTLFVADHSAGETSTLQSWSLTIVGVPEPTSFVLTVITGGVMLSAAGESESRLATHLEALSVASA